MLDQKSLAAWCGRFSPLFGVEADDNPTSLLLEIGGTAHLFGGEAAMVERMVGELSAGGWSARLAAADTLGGAWAAAHFGEAAHRAILVPPGGTAAALRPLPIEALRLPPETVALLHSLGVRRIEQLESLPRRELCARFGPRLAERWDQAMGGCSEPLPVCDPPLRLAADWSPEYPAARRETIAAAMEQLIGRLAATLVQCGRGVLRLQCRLSILGKSPLEFTVGLFEPTARPENLLPLVQMHLERLSLAGPVQAISVEAATTAPLEDRQQELFPDGATRSSPRRLAGLIERLSSRLGPEAVVRAHLRSEAQPELACRYEPLLHASRRRGAGPGELPPRPLRLLPRPLGLAALSLPPEGPPRQWVIAGRRQQIAHCWGPERIETGWWRGRPIGRDYYRVETTAARRFWVFRRLRDGKWFLHGMFE